MPMMFFSSILISFFISTILLTLSMILSKKKKYSEKLSAFECGFNFISQIHTPFSMKFFIISIIFLIFDIEIILLIPLILSPMFFSLKTWLMSFMMFLIILIWGLLHEWSLNSLKWQN